MDTRARFVRGAEKRAVSAGSFQTQAQFLHLRCVCCPPPRHILQDTGAGRVHQAIVGCSWSPVDHLATTSTLGNAVFDAGCVALPGIRTSSRWKHHMVSSTNLSRSGLSERGSSSLTFVADDSPSPGSISIRFTTFFFFSQCQYLTYDIGNEGKIITVSSTYTMGWESQSHRCHRELHHCHRNHHRSRTLHTALWSYPLPTKVSFSLLYCSRSLVQVSVAATLSRYRTPGALTVVCTVAM